MPEVAEAAKPLTRNEGLKIAIPTLAGNLAATQAEATTFADSVKLVPIVNLSSWPRA